MNTTIAALHAATDLVAGHLRRLAAACSEHPEVSAEAALTDAAADVEDAMLLLIARSEQRTRA